MKNVVSDEEVGQQILRVFRRNKVTANGMLRRPDFFAVRDGDFQRHVHGFPFDSAWRGRVISSSVPRLRSVPTTIRPS